MEVLTQLLISLVPAIIAGFTAYYKAKKDGEVELKKARTEIEKAKTKIEEVKEKNEGEIKKIKAQREADLDFYKGKLEAEREERISNENEKMVRGFFGDVKSAGDLKNMAQDFKDLEDTLKDLGWDDKGKK